MLKTLIKKELFRFFKSATTLKGNKHGSKAGTVAMICLWGLVYFSLIMAFIGTDSALGDVLLLKSADLAWVFFAINGIMGFGICVLLSMFMTSSALFNAKDNELLGAMPIPPAYILASRMSSLYLQNILYCSVPAIAAILSCFFAGTNEDYLPFSPLSAVMTALCIFPIALLALSLACVFGWLIALAGRKMKNKSAGTVILSVLFFGVYYYFNFNMQKYVMLLARNSTQIGNSLNKNILALPIKHMGLACTGNILSYVIFCIFAVAVFAVVCFVLSANYRKITTATSSAKKVEYKRGSAANAKGGSVFAALHKKELGRFLSSPSYMLNCGLGTLFMIGLGVAAIIKRESLVMLAEMMFGRADADIVYMAICAAACFMASANNITAPSISLEGNMLWILQSSPVDIYQVFKAKKTLQAEFTIVPAIIFMGCALFAMGADISNPLVPLMFIILVIFIFLDANMGLIVNLKFPKLDWTNEAVPIKQSLSTLVMLFVPWVIITGIAGIYLLLDGKLGAENFLMVLIVALAVLYRFTDSWLRTKGKIVFSRL